MIIYSCSIVSSLKHKNNLKESHISVMNGHIIYVHIATSNSTVVS